ncbi:MAG: phenylalanine--tRNA ligase subunit alpha [Candidatus Pacebacteria bacterium]|nr:phenylalanine--tRNA ligase subunit alpha [Candidatus Paceibacterota bacterium]
MKDKIEKIKKAALAEISAVESDEGLEEVRVKYLGRKSELTEVLKGLRDMSVEEKKEIGQISNLVKNEIESAIIRKETEMKEKEFAELDAKEKIDVTYPGEKVPVGHLHPLTKTRYEVEDIFRSMGFLIADGREVEDEFHNFDALNIPQNHPARDMWDTFWLKDGNLLRTHTSPMQVRFMEENKPPFRIIVPGRTFRFENSDATHESNFHQVEGLMVDESGKLTVANFKSVMAEFMKGLFGKELEIRLRPSYFPFVEPGFEIDVACPYCAGKGCRICKMTGWIEILGAGMVNQKVFTSVGLEEGKYEGFAFGVGLERIAMIKTGVNDLRLFYGNDMRFLEQF